jgi:hypothetical protein
VSASRKRDTLVDSAARAICYGTIDDVTFTELPCRHTRIELERAYRHACGDRTILRAEVVRLRTELAQTVDELRTLARAAVRTAHERDKLRATLDILRARVRMKAAP